ncbi:MAG: hypothetical protein K0R15_400 [Clostridiales bacterium]|jgi:hypothetical protein|nr:hypothetical protein [Clostridiales bacterium]
MYKTMWVIYVGSKRSKNALNQFFTMLCVLVGVIFIILILPRLTVRLILIALVIFLFHVVIILAKN